MLFSKVAISHLWLLSILEMSYGDWGTHFNIYLILVNHSLNTYVCLAATTLDSPEKEFKNITCIFKALKKPLFPYVEGDKSFADGQTSINKTFKKGTSDDFHRSSELTLLLISPHSSLRGYVVLGSFTRCYDLASIVSSHVRTTSQSSHLGKTHSVE